MISAFLPCRKGSERIPNKNVKPFAGIDCGLLNIKMVQLLACDKFDEIVVSSNDERVLDFSKSLKENRIRIDERPNYLSSNDTLTDDLIKYVPSIIAEGDVVWTHVTSPFITHKDYTNYIAKYQLAMKEGWDSLMTVKPLKGFIWSEHGPINYDANVEKWPRTQTIKPIYEIDSGAFINSIENYKKCNDRIGNKPFLYNQIGYSALDIDWPEEFTLAEFIWKQRSK